MRGFTSFAPDRRQVIAVALVVCLTACAAAPPPQPFDPARSAAALQARRLDDAGVLAALQRAGIAAPVGEQGWTLDALTVAAWQLRPELAQARAGERAASADVAAAARKPNPLLSFTPEWIYNAPAGVSTWIAALLVSQVFENPDKRAARSDQARARERQALWQQAQTAWDLRAQVRAAALELQLDQRAAQLASRELALRRESLALSRQRMQAGLLSATALEPVQLLALQAAAQADAARQAVASARGQLAAAVGVPADALADSVLHTPAIDNVHAFTLPDAAALREAAAFNRVDLALALAAYDQADAAWREQVARRHPDLTLGPGYTYDVGDRKLVLAMSSELPVNDRYDAAIAAAQARREAAARQVEAVQAQAMAALEQAQQQVGATRQALQQARSRMALQRRLVAHQQARWHAGAIDHGSAVLAQIDALQAQREWLAALRAHVAALGALEAAVQRPLWPASTLAPRAAIATPSPQADQ